MFPDDLLSQLPPQGITIGMKALLYAGILTIILTVLFTWIFSRKYKSSTSSSHSNEPALHSLSVKLANEDDKIAALKAEKKGMELIIDELTQAKNTGLLATSSYVKLKRGYDTDLLLIQQKIEDLSVNEDILSDQLRPRHHRGSDDDELFDEDLSDLEADLQSRLTSDDPLFPSALRDKQSGSASTVASGNTPKTTQVKNIPAPAKSSDLRADAMNIPAPVKSSIPAPTKKSSNTPSATTSIPAPTKSSIPAPPTKSSATPSATTSIPAPTKSSIPAPTKSNIPPPTKNSIPAPTRSSSEDLNIPSAKLPDLSTTIESDENEPGKFAKSTSIAALRMDMLKELARLKKYISEDEE